MTGKEREALEKLIQTAKEGTDVVVVRMPLACALVIASSLKAVCRKAEELAMAIPPETRDMIMSGPSGQFALLGGHVARGLIIEELVEAGHMQEEARDELGLVQVLRFMEKMAGEEEGEPEECKDLGAFFCGEGDV